MPELIRIRVTTRMNPQATTIPHRSRCGNFPPRQLPPQAGKSAKSKKAVDSDEEYACGSDKNSKHSKSLASVPPDVLKIGIGVSVVVLIGVLGFRPQDPIVRIRRTSLRFERLEEAIKVSVTLKPATG